MQSESYWTAVLASLVAALIGWLLSGLRQKARANAANARAESAKDVELATLRERALRLMALESELEIARQGHQAADAALADLRASAAGELNRLKAELASASQVASRLLAERDEARASSARAEGLIATLREDNSRTAAERGAAEELVARLDGERGQLSTELASLRNEFNSVSQELVDLRARAEKDREGFESQLQLLLDAKASLTEQFKVLATDILEEKSKRFAEQNQSTLNTLLEPLRNKLGEFQSKVEEVYVQEGKDRSALQEQIRGLVTLNKTLSDDAKNLTEALKGSSKAQGGWGEIVLERVLELSGLRRGIEYVAQESQTRPDGTRAVPDVVIHLPEARQLVVDSKVSLVAYERCVTASDDEAREASLRAHLDSVRSHIRALSEKRYEDLNGIQSPDFVLAFIPIEPAFMLAVTNDSTLFQEAWDRNVLLVSPSTLLFVVRTVAHLWRQEAQTRNAQEIARRGAELYDKLAGFVGDLQSVGTRLKQAREAYDLAESKLATGRGNVIRQAEMLRSLGVKPAKALPAPLVESALCDEAEAAEVDTATVAD
jgi:DNA recombination protein RmuC